MGKNRADWRNDLFMRGKIRNICGIYVIVNRKNNLKYIGQSHHLQNRRESHWSLLVKGKHENKKLQKDFDEFGRDAFLFSVIEYTIDDQGVLDKREQYWINRLHSAYNILKDVAYSRAYYSSVDVLSIVTLAPRETYMRPEWHKWVYGGIKTSQEKRR